MSRQDSHQNPGLRNALIIRLIACFKGCIRPLISLALSIKLALSGRREQLALEGGPKAITLKLPSPFTGGGQYGLSETFAALSVLISKRLFRYYGIYESPSAVTAFERDFAGAVKTEYCLGINSGTSAIMGALKGLEIGPGDEVILPAYSFIATACAVTSVGAVPVLAEIDQSLTIDPHDVTKKITSRTKAVIAVHMRGAPCNMDALDRICSENSIALVEDVAQAAGGHYKGTPLGSLGHVGAFSFQFNKMMTAGEGGAITTSHELTHRRALMFHDVNSALRQDIPPEDMLTGMNLRMTEMQGAMLRCQLKRLQPMKRRLFSLKKELVERISPSLKTAGVELRPLNDSAGELAICLILQLPEDRVHETARVASALCAEGLPALQLYNESVRDHHIYTYWDPILSKKSWSSEGGPWRWGDNNISYHKEMCPRTLNILAGSIQVELSPAMGSRHMRQISRAINKVITALL